MKLKNFAIDFGNGYVKAVSEKGQFIAPAKLGYEHDLGTSTLVGEQFSNNFDINLFKYKEDENNHVFGVEIEDAINSDQLLSTDSTNNRYMLPAFKKLVDFALTELASMEEDTKIDVRLITGMPSEDIQKPDFLNAFETFLKGHHVVERNGIEYVINIVELKIIEQPLGTLLNVFLNDKLQVHKIFKDGLVVVIDFGAGTTIVDIYRKMKRIGGKTLPNGMIQFNRSIATILSSNHNIAVSNEMIEEGIRNKTFVAELGQEKIKFKKIFDSELQKKLQNIIQTYEREIGQEEYVNDFILTGGGSFVIGEELQEIKPKFRSTDNPQLSTATGYYKLAKSMRKEE